MVTLSVPRQKFNFRELQKKILPILCFDEKIDIFSHQALTDYFLIHPHTHTRTRTRALTHRHTHVNGEGVCVVILMKSVVPADDCQINNSNNNKTVKTTHWLTDSDWNRHQWRNTQRNFNCFFFSIFFSKKFNRRRPSTHSFTNEASDSDSTQFPDFLIELLS